MKQPNVNFIATTILCRASANDEVTFSKASRQQYRHKGTRTTYRVTKCNNTLHVVNFHCKEIMFDCIDRDFLHSRKFKKGDHF